MALIRSLRKTKYCTFKESEIPLIDFFRIGDYRIVNNGFVYPVRNSGSDSFSIVQRAQIRPGVMEVFKDERRNGNAKADSRVDSSRSKRGTDRGGSKLSEHRERKQDNSKLRRNDSAAQTAEEPHGDLSSRESASDSRTGIKERLTTSDREPHSISGTDDILFEFMEEAEAEKDSLNQSDYLWKQVERKPTQNLRRSEIGE